MIDAAADRDMNIVTDTLMARETLEAASVCQRQFDTNRDLVREMVERLRGLEGHFAATLARGSSDQAAAFAKVLFETRASMPTLSQAPSLGALYKGTSDRFRGVPVFAVSQSGRSPDLILAAQDARKVGATLIAVVNDECSPLAELADMCLPVRAGPERSVAATKSFVATLVALAHVAAEWAEDDELLEQLSSIGGILSSAFARDWAAAVPPLSAASSLLVLGRGLTLPIAGEAALKLKEAAHLHAEAFSVAEVAHGPMTLIGKDDPVLVLGPLDQAREGLRDRILEFTARGATVIAAGHPNDVAAASVVLPSDPGLHPVVAAIANIQSFYRLAERLAVARGRDPDRPPHLSKVTQTL